MSVASSTAPSRPHTTVRGLARLANPFVLWLAGTRLLPMYGVIQHRGRRSGKTFRTPVVMRSTAAGLVVPMPWGERTDWYRNIRAAGGCVVRLKGRTFEVQQPTLLEAETVAEAFNPAQFRVMRRLGIRQCVLLRPVR